ncbi:hypothetical protein ABEB36_012906 [Hypothenemus hampei]|uniref:Transposase n=1 Tax=Hypothenemus hampei TaxID=57062 RepID=A0ABD1E653_HYPHA
MFKIVKKWREQGTIERARGTGLENKKTTNNEDATLIQHLRAHPFTTATAAAQITNFPASRRTAQRRIRQISDFRCRVAAIKPFLTQQNKENRMGYAMQYLIFDQNFWENVIFTDEKVFQSSRNGKIRVFRPPKSRFNETYTKQDNRCGRFSVNVWAWISSWGPGLCWRIDGRLNGTLMLISWKMFSYRSLIYYLKTTNLFSNEIIARFTHPE